MIFKVYNLHRPYHITFFFKKLQCTMYNDKVAELKVFNNYSI